MKHKAYIKCSDCGIFVVDSDVCTQCGKLLNAELIRAKETEERLADQQAIIEEQEKEDAQTTYYKLRHHRLFGVRLLMALVHSVWVIVMAIGSFFAWIAAMISA
jgi:hypothetical protein